MHGWTPRGNAGHQASRDGLAWKVSGLNSPWPHALDPLQLRRAAVSPERGSRARQERLGTRPPTSDSQLQTGRQKATLPFPRLRWHRKHFLGLSDSTPHQSWNRTAFLVRKVFHFLEEKELGAEREGANRRCDRERGRGFLCTAHH